MMSRSASMHIGAQFPMRVTVALVKERGGSEYEHINIEIKIEKSSRI
jgi:hypothetical protein